MTIMTITRILSNKKVMLKKVIFFSLSMNVNMYIYIYIYY